MELVLLGTGCPNVDPDRLGPSQIIVHGDVRVLVDCGSGVTQRLVAAGTSGRQVDALFLTHLHSDHVVDLFQLVSTSWQQGRDRPQRIFGPKGTRNFVTNLMDTWRKELDLRVTHEQRSSNVALECEVREIEPGHVWEEGGLRVTTVEVDHKPVEPAFGFVLEADGRKVVISGDTRYCPALIDAARGADVLVHEVLIHREFKVIPGVRTEETVANVSSYHTPSEQVGRVAAEAGVKMLVLSHFAPTRFDKAALLREVRADFGGRLVVGEDLMRIDVDEGTLRHAGAFLAFGDG